MPLLSFTHMAQRHTPLQLAADLGAAVLDTSITLCWRWPIFLAAGMTSRDSAELNRMVSEKVAAAASGTAAQTETMRIASRALRGKKTPHVATTVVAAALKPELRTVKANAKRLGKKPRLPSDEFLLSDVTATFALASARPALAQVNETIRVDWHVDNLAPSQDAAPTWWSTLENPASLTS
jgi:hypothetical protein